MYIFEEIQFLGILIFSYLLDENLHEKKRGKFRIEFSYHSFMKENISKIKMEIVKLSDRNKISHHEFVNLSVLI